MSVKLYELADSYKAFLEFGEEHEDVDTSSYLSEIADGIEAKAEAICKILRCLEAEAKAFAEETKRLETLSEQREKRVRSLREYLKSNLEVTGIKKLRAGLFTVAIQDSPPSCEIIDTSLIPISFQKQVVTINKESILEAIKAGILVPGAALRRGTYLRIR